VGPLVSGLGRTCPSVPVRAPDTSGARTARARAGSGGAQAGRRRGEPARRGQQRRPARAGVAAAGEGGRAAGRSEA
jgi:hypothetical protein